VDRLTAYQDANPVIQNATLPAPMQDFADNFSQANQAELPAMAKRFKAIAEQIRDRKEGWNHFKFQGNRLQRDLDSEPVRLTDAIKQQYLARHATMNVQKAAVAYLLGIVPNGVSNDANAQVNYDGNPYNLSTPAQMVAAVLRQAFRKNTLGDGADLAAVLTGADDMGEAGTEKAAFGHAQVLNRVEALCALDNLLKHLRAVKGNPLNVTVGAAEQVS